MNPDTYFFKLNNKPYWLTRTCQGRWFDISGCRIPMNNEIPDRDGLVSDAIPMSNEEVAELLAKLVRARVKRSKKNRIRRLGLASTLRLVEELGKEAI